MSAPAIYVAAPYARAPYVREVHSCLADLGMRIASRWAYGAPPVEVLPETPTDLERASLRATRKANLEDLRGADCVLALTFPGEGREMWAEIHEAIREHVPVLWAGPVLSLAAYEPGVHRVPTVSHAIQLLVNAAKQRAQDEYFAVTMARVAA